MIELQDVINLHNIMIVYSGDIDPLFREVDPN
jgi:hypothetical protein